MMTPDFFRQVIVDLGYRSVDADYPGVQIIHRVKYKSLSPHARPLLKRRRAIAPLIGHTKADHRMHRCLLQRSLRDALHALRCAAGYNIRWLLRAITRLGLGGLFCAFIAMVMCALDTLHAMLVGPQALRPHRLPSSKPRPGPRSSMSVAAG